MLICCVDVFVFSVLRSPEVTNVGVDTWPVCLGWDMLKLDAKSLHFAKKKCKPVSDDIFQILCGIVYFLKFDQW